jgi:hypothetical protein
MRASVRPDALLLMVWREGLAAKRSPSGLAKDLRSVGSLTLTLTLTLTLAIALALALALAL